MVYVAGPAAYRDVLDSAIEILQLNRAAIPYFIKQVEQELGLSADRMDVSGIVRNLSIPCLVMHAINDAEVPFSAGQSIADAWPNAKIIPFEDLGHMRILWDPSSVQAAVDFVCQTTVTRQTKRQIKRQTKLPANRPTPAP